jgi:hypothetical protein
MSTNATFTFRSHKLNILINSHVFQKKKRSHKLNEKKTKKQNKTNKNIDIISIVSWHIYIYFFFSYFEKNNENIGPPSTGHGHVKL